MNIDGYIQLYRDNLLSDVIPFWLKNSGDKQFGGYFTCLDRQGKVYDTDKFIWLQNRQVWTFAMLYNQVEQNEEWLRFASQGARFLTEHGRDQHGNWYFSLTREGNPLVQPYNIFSDCFACMAFAQLYKATKDEEYRDIAVKTFQNILSRETNPKGAFNKTFPGTRDLKGFSMPMILSNLVLDMESVLEAELVDKVIQHSIHSVMDIFFRPELGLIVENVTSDGHLSDSFEGRLINPGHGLEAMWFIMDLGKRSGDEALIKKAVDISINILEYGWDREYEGIFYFLDSKAYPPQQLEWDQKLWWVHIEAIVCLLKGYLYTGDARCRNWFEKLHNYTWRHFPDKKNGEWFGYLNRRGEVLLPLKGGKWKGCFHVPRGLYQCWKTLSAIQSRSTSLINQ